MADTPKDQKQQSGGFVRWLGIVNEGVGDGLKETAAGLGFVLVDSINNIPRLANLLPGVSGVGKMTERPVGGSDWIREKWDAGKKATDSALGVTAPVPHTTAERVVYNSTSAVTQVVAPVAIARGANALASVGTRAETAASLTGSATRTAAASADDLSLMAARRIAGSDKSVITKLELLSGRGANAEGQIERMFALMRKDGLSEKAFRETSEIIQLGKSSIAPDKAKVYLDTMREIFTKQQGAGWIGGKIDSLRASFAYAQNYPGSVALSTARAALTTRLGLAATTVAATAGGLGIVAMAADPAGTPAPDAGTSATTPPASSAPATSTYNRAAVPPAAAPAPGTPSPATAPAATTGDPAMTQQTPPPASPPPAAASTAPNPATPGATEDPLAGMKDGLESFFENSGLKNLWNGPTMRGVRQWANNSPIGKAVTTFGAAFLAVKLADAFLPDGMKSSNPMMARIGMLVLFAAAAYFTSQNLGNNANMSNRSAMNMAFGGASPPASATTTAEAPAAPESVSSTTEQVRRNAAQFNADYSLTPKV